MPKQETDQNKINILLNEYSNFYLGVIRTEGLLSALKKLPEDMILEKRSNRIVRSRTTAYPEKQNS